jgi:NAD(P)-dependent dehydrogenase (short-subunit alcohol dehydrogenase family)
MSLTQYFKNKGPSGFSYGSTSEQVTGNISLEGKNILVTGCNSGLGAETVRVLAKRGARILGTARTVEKAREALGSYGPDHIALECELANPASVNACVEEIKRLGIKLDAIIANAGIMALPKLEKAHGYELQFFTNHIGHFILVTGLLDSLTETGRVVMLSSGAHNMAPKSGIEFDNLRGEKSYSPWNNYGQSKFANILFAKELARRFSGTQKTANAVHPGVIQTNLSRNMNPVLRFIFGLTSPLFLKSVAQGAATQIYVATHPSLANVSGEYFSDNNIAKCRNDANDAELAKKLWEVSEKIVSECK